MIAITATHSHRLFFVSSTATSNTKISDAGIRVIACAAASMKVPAQAHIGFMEPARLQWVSGLCFGWEAAT